MSKIIAANWKMHADAEMAQQLAGAVVTHIAALSSGESEVILFPPFPYLQLVRERVQESAVRLGAQDCHGEQEGAHTGDVSAAMLKDCGCGYVLAGHSERRVDHGETSVQVRLKAEAALAAGLVALICIGETLEEREAGHAEAVVARQLRESLPKQPRPGDFLLAYEPVWAIGTGKVPSQEEIAAMHRHIRKEVPGAKVLYGGSVKPANAQEILAIPGVSGALVGGASLKAEDFCAIVDAGCRACRGMVTADT